MPMYEYICEDCGREFEKIVRYADANTSQPCPNCSSNQTHKKISISAAIGSVFSGGSTSSSSAGCGSGGGFT